jgi:hypothetical protein
MDWTALVTAFADMGDRVDGGTGPGRIAGIQALAGCAADELIYEFVLRPDGPGGSAGLGSQCAWIGEFWPIGATAINVRLVSWAGYALGDAQWSNSSVAHACVAASRRIPHRAIDVRLALKICHAADSVNFDEAAPELGVARAYDVSVDELAALDG